jgi:hypothetical protein
MEVLTGFVSADEKALDRQHHLVRNAGGANKHALMISCRR